MNKTCHRDRIAHLTTPCPSHKKLNVKLFANADAAANADTDTNAGGSTIALPGLPPGKLKMYLIFYPMLAHTISCILVYRVAC